MFLRATRLQVAVNARLIIPRALRPPPLRVRRFTARTKTLAPTPWKRALTFLTTPSTAIARVELILLKTVPWLLASCLSAHVFFTYFYAISFAWGISMLPTIASSGDWLLISKYYRKGRCIGVGDVVSFRSPTNENMEAVKRVIGMPGDLVLRDTPGRSPAMIQVPAGHCWVVGDNLTWSLDSRLFGPVPLALIKGKIVAKGSGFRLPSRIQHGLQPAEVAP